MNQITPLLSSDVGPIRVLTIASGAKVNPLSVDLQQALLDACQAINADPSVRAVVLTGQGRTFCVGADLATMQTQGEPGTSESVGNRIGDMMETLTNRVVLALQRLRVPVVSAVNGIATGAGVGLAFSADIVVSARSAFFQLPFMTRLGIVPDVGVSWFLQRLAGANRATALTLLGDRLEAERAAEWGLVWSCVDDEALMTTAMALAHKLTALPAHAALETRALYRSAMSESLAGQLDYEARRQRELLDSSSFAEGVKAFFEKRDPVFTAS